MTLRGYVKKMWNVMDTSDSEEHTSRLAILEQMYEELVSEKAVVDAKLDMLDRIDEIFLQDATDGIYQKVLDIIVPEFESRFGLFGYVDRDGAMVNPSMKYGIVLEQCNMPDQTIRFPRTAWGGVWGRTLKAHDAAYFNDDLSVPELHVPVDNVMIASIVYQRNLIGNLQVANKKGGYTDDDLELLKRIADHIAYNLDTRLKLQFATER